MAKYFDKTILADMNEARKEIFAIRAKVYAKYKIDVLDTDALSSLSIYEIVSQYDHHFNVNFSRNGEDAKSTNGNAEIKSTRVSGNLTRTGRPRKGAGSDAAFLFHAMGDIDHSRYLFVAKNKEDLSVVRLYDISNPANCKIVQDHLHCERDKWLEIGLKDKSKMKRDIIVLTEKFLTDNIKFKKQTISNCDVYRD